MNSKKWGISLLLTLVLAAGCRNGDSQEKTAGSSKNTGSNPQTVVEITTFDYEKNPMTQRYDQIPERVVAVYQSPIEIMLALGLEDHLAAAAQLDTEVKPQFQAAFEKVKYYAMAPSKEEVLGLDPDLIFSWYSYFGPEKLGDIAFWQERGTHTYIAQNSGIKEPNSLENEYEDIRNIAKIFQVEDKAEQLIGEMQEEINQAKNFVEGKEKVSAIIIEVQKDGMYRVYGADSIGGDMAQQVGATLVAAENTSISKEALIQLDPDVIFSVYYGEAIEEAQAVSTLVENAALQNLSAVKNERVKPIVLSEVYSTGIRTFDGIVTIAEGLYPELYQ